MSGGDSTPLSWGFVECEKRMRWLPFSIHLLALSVSSTVE